MKYLSIDVETTGLDPNTSQLLEVGLVVADSNIPFVQTKDNSLRIVLLREEIKGNIFALNMNQKLLATILAKNAELKEKNKDETKDFGMNETTEFVSTYYISLDALDKINEPLDVYITFLLNKFFVKNGLDTGKITVAGKNFASFDKRFLEPYESFKTMILDRMHHRVLDVGSMFVEYTDECIPDLKTCLKRAGFENEVPHTAVEDAILVIHCAQFKFGSIY